MSRLPVVSLSVCVFAATIHGRKSQELVRGIESGKERYTLSARQEVTWFSVCIGLLALLVLPFGLGYQSGWIYGG
jgi:hypothetical protein